MLNVGLDQDHKYKYLQIFDFPDKYMFFLLRQ